MIAFKTGVDIGTPTLALVYCMMVVSNVFQDYGETLVITSICDGEHMPGSFHYVGRAFDFRSRSLVSSQQWNILRSIKEKLGRQIEVYLENRDTSNEHFHLEVNVGFTPTRTE